MAAHEDPAWEIIDALFAQGGGDACPPAIARHQLESFNEFLDKKLFQIVQGFNPIQIYHQYDEDRKDFTFKVSINVSQPNFARPLFQAQDGSHVPMTPHLARMNGLTYAANLTVNIHIISEIVNPDGVIERTESTVPNVSLGKIPIMVRSKACVLTQLPGTAEPPGSGHECRFDPGGYFIVHGNEKVILSQDRISENRTYIFPPSGSTDGLYAEIRSVPDGVFLPPKTTSLHLSGKPNHLGRVIRVSASFLRAEVPLFVMFRALGVVSDRDIMAHVLLCPDDPRNARLLTELMASADDANDLTTMDAAQVHMLRFLGTTGAPREYMDQPGRAREILLHTIRQDFLPHVGPDLRRKALYLGYMVRKLLRIHCGYQAYDNRDSYLNKRVDTPGVLFSSLFRQSYGKMVKEMRNLIVRELNLWRGPSEGRGPLLNPGNIHRFFKATVMETGLRYALSTGNWGVKSVGTFQNVRSGVAQVLNRLSYLATVSHLRRINTPMEKNGKLVQPRKLDNTQHGMICPNETPEGAAVGLVKNMALSTHITTTVSSARLREVVIELGTVAFDEASLPPGTPSPRVRGYLEAMGAGADRVAIVMVHGDITGYHTDPPSLYEALRHLKRSGQIPPTTSVVWDIEAGVIQATAEPGRMCRPLHIVDDYKRLRWENAGWWRDPRWMERPFQEFLADVAAADEGFLEYLDVEEVDHALIASSWSDLKRRSDGRGRELPPRFTHCEIHPSLMNGVVAAIIPFMNHNQAPRNCYQCIWEEEPVLMADGSWRAIRDVRVGDEVVVFDPDTLRTATSKVVHQHTAETEKPIFRIRSAGGGSIIATGDHKFMTRLGWVEAQDLARLCVQVAICQGAGSPPVFEEVEVRPHPRVRIADITVESGFHSFVAGDGFMVHNSSMGKQAIGVYATNFRQRLDTMSHVLNYPQRPLAMPRLAKTLHMTQVPAGFNVMVAIMTYTGFNIEDSVMINRGSLDRGLFTSTAYKSFRDQAMRNHSTGEEEVFMRPPVDAAHRKPQNYDKLGEDGFVPENTPVGPNDVLIGKVMPHKVHGVMKPRDTSLGMKSTDEGIVDLNYTGMNGEGYRFAKVRLRQQRRPVIADKVASLSAQKGSVGMIYNPEDMPFTKEGIAPDLIMNPHAIPSRMTMAQIMETLMGKTAACMGAFGDATPFSGCTVEDIAGVLESYGYERYGNEVLYHGRTGEMIQTDIFIGPVVYNRLRHMVSDKQFSRAIHGPLTSLTRQPAEGRSKNGGLKIGEMERDAILAHGASTFIKERMLDLSDNYRVFTCKTCGMVATANQSKNLYRCHGCKNTVDVVQVRMPYAFHLLMSEINAMGLAARIHT